MFSQILQFIPLRKLCPAIRNVKIFSSRFPIKTVLNQRWSRVTGRYRLTERVLLAVMGKLTNILLMQKDQKLVAINYNNKKHS